ncbi:MAG: hypothetical protein K2K15_00370 [Anaeroplasmataceae bacterium]|nr:hypothetical protein [Anaeroplasmataceae bacterium]
MKKSNFHKKQDILNNKDTSVEDQFFLSDEEIADFENDIKEAIQMQLEEENKEIPDSILDQARLAMKEEQEKEKMYIKTHPVSDSVLDQATKEMKEKINVPTHLFKRLHTWQFKSVLTIVVLLLILIPVMSLYKSSYGEVIYGSSSWYQKEDYNTLDRKPIASIQKYSEGNGLDLVWMNDLEILESYACYREDKVIVLEEHYLFNGKECILYLMNLHMQIDLPDFPMSDLSHAYKSSTNRVVVYTINENIFYGSISEYHKIFITYPTNDLNQIDQLLGFLKKYNNLG